jgi:esterase/lipase superfamily enzyme
LVSGECRTIGKHDRRSTDVETGLFSDPARKPLPLILIRSGSTPNVNILAHSMGGLLVREAVQGG